MSYPKLFTLVPIHPDILSPQLNMTTAIDDTPQTNILQPSDDIVSNDNIFGGYLWLIGLFTLWRLFSVCRVYCKQPMNMDVAGLPTVFGQWITSLRWIFASPKIMAQVFSRARGAPFAIPTLSGYVVCVSSDKDVKDLNRAQESTLSMNTALGEASHSKYTINGFKFLPSDPHSSVPTLTLRAHLRPNLPILRPKLETEVERGFGLELASKLHSDTWTPVSAPSVTSRLVGRLNNYIIVGEHLAKDPAFFDASMRYVHDAAVTMQLLELTPTMLHPLIGNVGMGWSGAGAKVYSDIRNEIQKRASQPSDAAEKPLDCIRWVIETSRSETERTMTRMTQQVTGLLFAAAHQVPMLITFALYNLCIHPEYVEPLRQEALSHYESSNEILKNEDMPLLDSFLKETSRMDPQAVIMVRRKVIKPLTLVSGGYVPAGNIITMPQGHMLRDPSYYPNPDSFQPFRHVPPEGAGVARSDHRFTHPSHGFPFWGAVRRACPARFYVSIIAKMILVHFLMHYEFKLQNPEAPRTFSLGAAVVPRPGTVLLVRKRL